MDPPQIPSRPMPSRGAAAGAAMDGPVWVLHIVSVLPWHAPMHPAGVEPHRNGPASCRHQVRPQERHRRWQLQSNGDRDGVDTQLFEPKALISGFAAPCLQLPCP
jgi:hypothetical protein